MGNTSTSNDKTVADDAKVKLIIGEIGRDTKTGIIGRGYSFDNGRTFHVTDTIYGRLYDDRDVDGVWNNGLHEKVKEKVNQEITNTVEPAIKQADSAVAYANDAIEKSRVNSQAIDDINSAVSDAVSDAAVARSDGLLAWNAAQSNVNLIDLNYASASAAISSARTEAIAAADEAKKSASAAQADIVVVKSSVATVQADVTATRSDVAVAKSDIADTKTTLKQTASGLSSKISGVATSLADTTSALSDAKTAFNSDVAEAKNLANAAQTTADSAIKSASSVASDLTAVASQAKANADGITKVTSDVGLLQTTVTDNSGNISTIQETAKQIQQAVSDNAGNITVAKQTAGSAVAVASDAKSNATVAIQTASQASITASNASGQAASAVITANGAMTTASDAKSNAIVAVQTASGASLTATNANSDATVAKQTASEAKIQASNAESDFAQLSIRAGQIEASVANNSGAITSVQQTANGLTTTVANIKANGGGRNLASDTDQEYAMGFGIPNTTWQDGYAYLKLPTTIMNNGEILPQDPHSFYYILTQGTTYTQTIWFETDATVKDLNVVQITWFTNNVGHDLQPARVQKIGQNSYKVVSTYTWPGKTDNNVRLFDIEYLNSAFDLSTGTYLKFGKLELENGTISHDWSPAPEDTDVKITTNTTAIEQNKKAITLKADQTVVDKTNGTVQQLQSQLKVQEGQINAKVSSSDLPNLVGGGGRNLLPGTRDFKQWGTSISKVAVTNGQETFQAVTGTQSSSATYYDIVCFSNLPLEKDTDYTASFWAKTSENVDIASFLFNSGSNGNYADGATVNHATTEYKRFVVHFHNGNNTATPNFIPVRINKTGVTVWLYGCMLEKGTIAHDWQPSPEDAQTYTQTQIKQTADSWNANLTDVKNGLTDKYTNLHATVDGIQAQVFDKNGSSRITQLSDLIATKVSQGDYNSQITQLKDDINLRVQKGNVVSQINQEAGGNTLIQVANGEGKLALNASSVVFSGSAFIPDAYISTLNADKLRFYDSSGNVATMSAGLKQYDDDKTNHTVTLQYSGGYEVHASNLLGSILTMHDNSIRLAVKANGMSSSGSNDQYSGVYVMTHYTQLSNYRSDGKSPGIYITDDGFTILGDDSGVGTKWGDLNITTPQLYLTGTNKCQINGSNSQVTLANNWSMVHANNDLWLETKNSQIHLGDNVVDIANKNNSNTSNYDVHLTLRGYVNMTGWLTCMGLTQTSRLSTKTRIEPLDTAKALELINSADVATYQYKQEVAHGGTKRHASVIIDDVHDVARYQTPDEFISEDRQGRSDGDIVGYLMGAVQELTKRIKTLESKVG